VPERVVPQALLSRCSFPPPGTEVTCAVSGGADSLALLVLAAAADLRVTAVHVDHGLRAGSAAEAGVVATAAARFGAAFRAERVPVDDGPNLEERARLARWSVLPPDALTGHTADDRAETVLINLARGTGPRGLAALGAAGRHPLLALRRTETAALCRAEGLEPVVDASNRDLRFVRNRIRHEVLPLLADVAGRDPVPLLCRAADHAAEAADALRRLSAGLDPTECRALRAADPALAAEALRRWLEAGTGRPPDRRALERVVAVVRGDTTGTEVSGGWRVARRGGRLRLERETGPGGPPLG
jgi:tRNA(Ile)-lysidine synthase